MSHARFQFLPCHVNFLLPFNLYSLKMLLLYNNIITLNTSFHFSVHVSLLNWIIRAFLCSSRHYLTTSCLILLAYWGLTPRQQPGSYVSLINAHARFQCHARFHSTVNGCMEEATHLIAIIFFVSINACPNINMVNYFSHNICLQGQWKDPMHGLINNRPKSSPP